MVIRGEYENKHKIIFKEAVSFRLTLEFFSWTAKNGPEDDYVLYFCGAFAF